jgi:ribonuclease HII
MALIKEGGERGELEQAFFNRGVTYIAGVDEAGRGPCAGPLVAAAVVLKDTFDPAHAVIKDSKKMSENEREEIFEYVQSAALTFAIIEKSADDIDKHGLHNMNKQAMIEAALQLNPAPELVLTDGYYLKEMPITSHGVWKGDSCSIAIAAASILAKVTRDRIMREMSEIYPQYGFDKHKGYSAVSHMQAIKEFGVLSIHRKSFANIAAIIEGQEE